MFSLKSIIILLVFILALHFAATMDHWYWTYSWFDIPMHFLGGFWVAMVFLWLNLKFKILSDSLILQLPYYLITALITLSFVALIGVFWEFFEFLYDVFISSRGYSGFMQLGAADMIGDLFFDLFGASAFLIIYRIFNRRQFNYK